MRMFSITPVHRARAGVLYIILIPIYKIWSDSSNQIRSTDILLESVEDIKMQNILIPQGIYGLAQ